MSKMITAWGVMFTVYAAQPREGTETYNDNAGDVAAGRVYAAQPREGKETLCLDFDGLTKLTDKVYAAQPREGTETVAYVYRGAITPKARFMQLNPARGRKQVGGRVMGRKKKRRFMQLNPARGRKLTGRDTICP